MNGAGNDFVLIDNRGGGVHLNRSQIVLLCDRHRGIGADGVLLLEKATNRADFRMRYFNADGGEAEMCGNGARCFARFANKVAGAEGKISFETPAGVISAELAGDLVTLQMTAALRPIIDTAPTFLPKEKKFFLMHWVDCMGDAIKAEANAAYRAGQQEALARMQQQQPRVPSVTVVGQVSVPTIPWIEALTLAKALVTANYTGRTDPTEILIVRNGRAFRVDPKQLLSGEDVPLQAGDVVQIKQ